MGFRGQTWFVDWVVHWSSSGFGRVSVVSTTGSVHTSIGEYLKTSYLPDAEFVDGELREKPVVSPIHGRMQILIGVWFFQHQLEWKLVASAEARTQVSVSRVRLPDVVVGEAGFLREGALTEAPLIAIEVLSAQDSMVDLRRRAEDLEAMGVANLWLIDPETRDAFVWKDGYWQKSGGERLDVIGSAAFLDLKWLWLQMGLS